MPDLPYPESRFAQRKPNAIRMMRRNKSQETPSLNNIKHFICLLAGHSASGPVLGKIILICLLAFIYACSDIDPEHTYTKKTTIMISETKALTENSATDILIFNDDRMQRLDSYQRITNTDLSNIEVSSTSGHKIFSVLANSQRELYDWADISSREGIRNIRADLKKERREALTMSGECRIEAGTKGTVFLKRLASEIVLQSISCDFSGREYEDHALENVKVYLTNVNSSAAVFMEDGHIPESIVNQGRLSIPDLEGFIDRDIIFQSISSPVGRTRLLPGISLLCYPNEAEEETPGTPFTRLVIEGDIDGKTYYWPFDINRKDGGRGIGRGCRYIFDIKLTRTGHSDPDVPIEIEDSEVILEVEEWEEKENYDVRF